MDDPSAFLILNNAQFGAYKLSTFYSESFSGVPYELDLLFPQGVGREDANDLQLKVPRGATIPTLILPYGYDRLSGKSIGGPQKTMRLIVLLHETSHLVHDLSLGAFLVRDSVLDYTSALAFECVRRLALQGKVVAPLLSKRCRSQWESDQYMNRTLRVVIEMESYLDRIMSETACFTDEVIRVLSDIPELESELHLVSGKSLAESLVATKTVAALGGRVKDHEDELYLKHYKNHLPILPENLPTTYRTPRRVFDAALRYTGIDVDYTLDDWPSGYFQSSRYLADRLFIYLTDSALHIPPYEFIETRVAERLNGWDDFIPAHRFSKIIKTIVRQGGLPLDPSGTHVNDYFMLFDWIASNQDPAWPTLMETNNAWKNKLGHMKITRREASDGYKFRMFVERDLRPLGVVLGDSLIACWQQWVPVFHLTPNGLKSLSGKIIDDQFYIAHHEIPDIAPYDFFFKDYGFWTDASAESNMKGQAENELIFRQEVVYRSICREIQRAILYKDSMCCPFANNGCQAAIKLCSHITQLGAIPIDGCCVREYLKQDHIEPENMIWLQ